MRPESSILPGGYRPLGTTQRRRSVRNNKRSVVLNLACSSRGARRAIALLAGMIAMLALPASANTIGISGGILILGAEPGDGNQVFSPTIVGSDLVIPNLDADIVTPGCSGVGTITCPLAGF